MRTRRCPQPSVCGPGIEASLPRPVICVAVLTWPRFVAHTELFAHGEIRPWDTNGSMTPAVAFTLAAHNPSATASLEVSLLLSMPLASQPDTARVDAADAPRTCAPAKAGGSALLCKAACDSAASCSAWSYEPDGLGEACRCLLIG